MRSAVQRQPNALTVLHDSFKTAHRFLICNGCTNCMCNARTIRVGQLMAKQTSTFHTKGAAPQGWEFEPKLSSRRAKPKFADVDLECDDHSVSKQSPCGDARLNATGERSTCRVLLSQDSLVLACV